MSDTSATGCLFCSIVDGTVPATIVATSPDAIAFEDIAPGAPVHVLVVPRTHLPGVDAIGPENAAVLGAVVDLANEVARDKGVAERGYRLVMNVGPDAGQTVPHLHVHVVGGRKLEWPPG